MLNYADCVLRPLRVSDKEMILTWRNSDRVRANMYTDHIISSEEHDEWLRTALSNESAKYLIFEFQGRPVGFVSFTGIAWRHGRCNWAFYLGETDVPKGTGSAMEFLALIYAFESLGIRKLCCEVFEFNRSVIKLHEKFGFRHEARYIKHVEKNGGYEDVVSLAKFRDAWKADKEMLRRRCFAPQEDDI